MICTKKMTSWLPWKMINLQKKCKHLSKAESEAVVVPCPERKRVFHQNEDAIKSLCGTTETKDWKNLVLTCKKPWLAFWELLKNYLSELRLEWDLGHKIAQWVKVFAKKIYFECKTWDPQSGKRESTWLLQVVLWPLCMRGMLHTLHLQ